MRPPPIALTVDEAVAAAGISRSALYVAIKRGDLIARKAGRRTLITYVDLKAYLANLPSFTGSH
jgi:excisionase family DNA binding protein